MTCLAETFCQCLCRGIQAQQHHAPAIGVALLNQRIKLLPDLWRLGLDFPPGRVNPQVVQALQRAVQHIGMSRRVILGRDDLQQQFMAADQGCLIQPLDLRFLLQAQQRLVVGVKLHQTLDDVFLGPANQVAANRATMLKGQWP